MYKIIIAPSSEDRDFLDSEDYDAILETIGEAQSAEEFSFTTKEEREAFILGYSKGVGWLGDDNYITKDE